MQHMALAPPPTNAAAASPNSAAGGAAALWAECDSASRDLVNVMFLDNPSLELYHNLLYGRCALRAACCVRVCVLLVNGRVTCKRQTRANPHPPVNHRGERLHAMA